MAVIKTQSALSRGIMVTESNFATVAVAIVTQGMVSLYHLDSAISEALLGDVAVSQSITTINVKGSYHGCNY